MDRIKDKYDVIIIGAGIGGLVCGCYLAKAGRKVLIVEKNDKPGGCCVSFKRNNFRFDAGVHVIGSCNKYGILYRIFKNLDIKQPFIRLCPTDKFFFLEDKIEVPNELDKYVLLLQQYFPKEKMRISIFFEDLIRIARNLIAAHKKYDKLTYQDFLNKYFEDMKLKSILSAQAGYLGLIPNDLSAVSMCAMLARYLKDGAYYPLGGASSLSNNLVTCFKSLGGRIIFQAKVVRLLFKDEKIAGVLINSSNNKNFTIYSDIVVSNIDATQTFFELMDSNSINDTIKKNIRQSKESRSLFILYLGVKINKKIIEEKIGWHYPTYDINENLNRCIYLASPSLYDNTASNDASNIIEAFELFPYQPEEVKDWDVCKNELEKKLFLKISKIIPEIEDGIIIKESATPKTIENHTGNKNGAPYGWSLVPGQFNRNEVISNVLNYNLYLTGHWTNPGGGILAVAISGYNTAKKILFKEKRRGMFARKKGQETKRLYERYF